jgi:putative ATP-dependent endonuclease of OLD family
MRIKRAHFTNFRCLDDVEVVFDDVTTFIGPNGVGKSTILRGLDWFFNGADLDDDDVWSGADEKRMAVEVEFASLTKTDREKLGKYAIPGKDTVNIWKSWEDGQEKLYGRGRSRLEFLPIRAGAPALERRRLYNELRASSPDFADLPSVTSDSAMQTELDQWETRHPDRLRDVDIDSATHLFGFAGQAVMSGLFDYVMVTADLRAGEQTKDTRGAILGRIIEQAIDRTGADADLADLAERMQSEHSNIQKKHFDDQLRKLSSEMTKSVTALSSGREVLVSAQEPAIQPQKAQFRVSIWDEDTETRVDRQGHGFQRALLLSALRLLAEHGRGEGEEGVICLAIEEPELFQHPLQSRNFARVLRTLATDASQGVQVAYATHSPYFIEPKSFHQIRRVRRVGGGSQGSVRVWGSDQATVFARVASYVGEDVVKRQLDGVCMGCLGEALFTDSVLLVEGGTDSAIFTGVAERTKRLYEDGACVADCGGKRGVLLPYAILEALGIPALIVVDNDQHLEDRLVAAQANGESDLEKSLRANVKCAKDWNRKLLKFFEASECDWPSGKVTDRLFFLASTLEQVMADDWPEWMKAKEELVREGLGVSGKNASTYHDACLCADGVAPECLEAILEKARERAKSPELIAP